MPTRSLPPWRTRSTRPTCATRSACFPIRSSRAQVKVSWCPASVRNHSLLDAVSARKEGDKPMPRELIDTGTDKRFVRRDKEGQFKESDDVGRSLAQDQKRDSKTKPKRGEGDRGDR